MEPLAPYGLAASLVFKHREKMSPERRNLAQKYIGHKTVSNFCIHV
jgi:hypothetical protein